MSKTIRLNSFMRVSIINSLLVEDFQKNSYHCFCFSFVLYKSSKWENCLLRNCSKKINFDIQIQFSTNTCLIPPANISLYQRLNATGDFFKHFTCNETKTKHLHPPTVQNSEETDFFSTFNSNSFFRAQIFSDQLSEFFNSAETLWQDFNI